MLGTGGKAQVWEATDRRLDRPVAVKLFAGEAVHETLRARSLHEARLAAQFAHRHAVAVYDVGEDSRILYLVMELVRGPTLAGVLAEREFLDVVEAVAIADQILGAVAAGHRAGLVHRDIKPSNILFTGDGVAKLGDFGIAKAITETATPEERAGKVVGTPRYLSPEQTAGAEATPASDVYAMGVVLFEMLTGVPPFSGDSPAATARAHREAPLPALVEHRRGLDPDLVAVIERALEKSPDARYPDAATMQRVLAVSPPALARARAFADTAIVRTRRLEVPPDRPPAHARRAAGASTRRRRSARVLAALVSLVLLAAVASAAVNLTGGGDDSDDDPALPQAAPTTATTSTTTAPTTQPNPGGPTSTEPDTTATTAAPGTTSTVEPDTTNITARDPQQPTVGTLVTVLAENPHAHGKRGDKLLDKLQQLRRETGEKQAERARKTIEDTSKWADKDELRVETALLAATVLEPLAAPPDQRP